MTESVADNFFTTKHAQLTRIASIANIFAWVVFVAQTLYVGIKFINVQNSYLAQPLQSATFGQNLGFMEMLATHQIYAAGFFMDLVSTFLQGVTLGLVLKGISVGLNMIVETNLNYKENSQEGNNE